MDQKLDVRREFVGDTKSVSMRCVRVGCKAGFWVCSSDFRLRFRMRNAGQCEPLSSVPLVDVVGEGWMKTSTMRAIIGKGILLEGIENGRVLGGGGMLFSLSRFLEKKMCTKLEYFA